MALALGISATTAAFSTFDALLLRTLPVPNAERLVVLAPPVDESVFRGRLPFSFYETLRETDAGFSGVLATTRNPAVLVSADVTASVGAEFVTPGYFDVLGVNPSLGRWSDDDAGAVVSHRLWTTAFDGRPDLLDTAVRINGRLFVITGVAPPEFTGTLVGDSVGGAPDLWLPISMFGRVTGVGTTAPRVDIMARLTPSETLDQAAARLPSVTQRWIEQTGAQATGPEATAVRLIPGSQGIPSSLRDAFRGSVWLLLGLCGCLWLIATTNAAGLGLARLRARHREIGVRLALGASWTRLARQLLTESALLAGLGGVLGVLVAHQLTRAVAVFAPAWASIDVGLSAEVLGVATVASLLAALLVSAVQALLIHRRSIIRHVTTGPMVTRRWGVRGSNLALDATCQRQGGDQP